MLSTQYKLHFSEGENLIKRFFIFLIVFLILASGFVAFYPGSYFLSKNTSEVMLQEIPVMTEASRFLEQKFQQYKHAALLEYATTAIEVFSMLWCLYLAWMVTSISWLLYKLKTLYTAHVRNTNFDRINPGRFLVGFLLIGCIAVYLFYAQVYHGDYYLSKMSQSRQVLSNGKGLFYFYAFFMTASLMMAGLAIYSICLLLISLSVKSQKNHT